jgi:hypothetical protein
VGGLPALTSARLTTIGSSGEIDRSVAVALGRRTAGEALVAQLLGWLEPVERRAAAADRPRVVGIEWLDPVMLGGTWMPEPIAITGGDSSGWRPASRRQSSTWPPAGRRTPRWWWSSRAATRSSAPLPAACTQATSATTARYHQAVRRVDADLEVHADL